MEESRDALWCPASALQAAACCPLGPDLGSAAAGPPVSLPFQSSVDHDQNRVVLLGILRFRGEGGSRNPRIDPRSLGQVLMKSLTPLGPLAGGGGGGELTLRKARRSLAPCRAGLAYCPEPPGGRKSARFRNSKPNGFPNARRSLRRPTRPLRNYVH